MMKPYFHSQKGKTPLMILSVPFVVMALLVSRGISQGRGFQGVWQLAAGSILVLAGMMIMSSMKTTVDSERLSIKLGPGIIKKTILLKDISGISHTDIPWYSSGIKKISGGWLFSVDRSPAIELKLSSGKRFIIGTDDPQGLERALTEQKKDEDSQRLIY